MNRVMLIFSSLFSEIILFIMNPIMVEKGTEIY